MAAAGDERAAKRACTAATTAARRCWSSMFPDDLLAVIYSMVASPRVRMRFAAVCRSWRAAARAAPAVGLPWLLHCTLLRPWDSKASYHLHIPEDGANMGVPLPGTRRLVGCHDGGWVVSSAPAPITIANIFSGVEMKLGENQGNQHHDLDSVLKIVFSEPPTSGDCILATITNKRSIGLTRVGSTDCGWTMHRYSSGMVLGDIMFYKNELYGLSKFRGELVKFEIGSNNDGAPVVIAEHRLAKSIAPTPNDIGRQNTSFIFDLEGKLAMARIRWSQNLDTFFSVFQLVDIHTDEVKEGYKNKWVKVTSLGDNALFLGQMFSKAVRVPEIRHGGVERNHIYFFHHHRYDSSTFHTVYFAILNESGHMDGGQEKDMANDEVKRIRSTVYITNGGNHGGTWILPPDV
ncbi:unnamed protein product [Alopecurus aequalis]